MSIQRSRKAAVLQVNPQNKRIVNRMSTALLLALIAIGASSPAQVTAVPGLTPRTLNTQAEDTLHLGVGDLVEVRVFDTPEFSSKLRINTEGALDMAVVGSTPVAGLTPQEAASALEKHLKDAKIMVDPRVTIFVADYATQDISVLGEVKNPGNYLLLGPHSLYSAISAAGGTSPKAGATIVITHQADPTHPQTIHVDSPNYSEVQRLAEVRPGDVVFVSRADSVYVIGDVLRPGEFPIQNGRRMDVVNAVALAEGTNPTAAVSKAFILRKTATGAETIPVDLTRITRNSEPDQILHPDDVVVIPRSRSRAFLDATLPGLTGAVAGSALAALILLSNH